MDFFEPFWEMIQQYVEPLYLVIFMLLGYLAKKSFNDLLDSITRIEWKPVYSVAIIAALVAIPFAIFKQVSWEKLLFTYALGTSLHELLLNYLEDIIKTKSKKE